MTKKIKKVLLNELSFPYTLSICVVLIFIISYFLNKEYGFIWIVEKEYIISLSNTFITIVSIFISFILVWLTLIYQSDSENIKMIKQNWLYGRLIDFFKAPLIFSLSLIFLSIFLSLWIWCNIVVYIFYVLLLNLVFFTSYRIFKYLFKILKD